jgi:preprotein translocase subunit SecE
VNYYLKLGIWVGVVGAVFLYLWRRGYLLRISNYVAETREELKKCTWPTREELKGSTVVVMVTLAILAAFTVGVDFVTSQLLSVILRIAG